MADEQRAGIEAALPVLLPLKTTVDASKPGKIVSSMKPPPLGPAGEQAH